MQRMSESLVVRLEALADQLEKMELHEYVSYLHDRRAMLRTNFVSGLARGLGMAVGFTVLGAVVIAIIQRIAIDNISGISGFLADVVRIVQQKL